MGIKLTFFFVIVSVLFFSIESFAKGKTCNSVKYVAPSGYQSDIIFNFDNEYICGQFINGDWWVAIGRSGFVKIVSITPFSENGLHGYELSPKLKNSQGFDYRIHGYDEQLKPRMPIDVSSTSSLIKAVSVPDGEAGCRPCIQFSAVLTVVDRPIYSSHKLFRPGYFGSIKGIYSFEKVDVRRLAKIPVSYVPESKKYTFDDIEVSYKGIRLDHLENWFGRKLHPVDNMPDYGAEIAKMNAVSILRMMLSDFDLANPIHKSAMVNYLQMGIDLKSMAEGTVTWPANGGHGNGRKLPILFAGMVFSDSAFKEAVLMSSFSEDEQLYFSDSVGRVLYGRKCGIGVYWRQVVSGKGPKDCRDPHGLVDGGGMGVGESYQLCCTSKPWKYTVLALLLLDMTKAWGNGDFFEYVDRWVEHGAWTIPDKCARFNGRLQDFGVAWGRGKDGLCIVGKGRYIAKHGINPDGGFYSNKMAEQIWQYYKSHSLKSPIGDP